jgi:hypothetical protein
MYRKEQILSLENSRYELAVAWDKMKKKIKEETQLMQ